jgi:serine/threonine-protein kinase
MIIAEKYKVLKKLGEGATGEVYLVQHADLDVQFALKILNYNLSSDETFTQLFKQEAGVLQRFSHPGITQLRDFGRNADGRYYMAMDYCPGISLKDVLERDGPYPTRSALRIVSKILTIIGDAHAQGIIHRDLKPGNVMIEDDSLDAERLKVLDFGTAFVREHIERDEVNSQQTMHVIGTPCYMSPEQAAGEANLDYRTDIYSIGIILYELLTGEVPFEGTSLVQTLLMQVTQPPPQFARRYNLSTEVENVVLRALEKDKRKRYQSAAEFREDCLEVLKTVNRGVFIPQDEVRKLSDEIDSIMDARENATTILCLDDDVMITDILQHILSLEGYEVIVANDCSRLYSQLSSGKVDLLVSDINMPGMSGTRICKMLKKTDQDLKIVLFSNIPERELEARSKASQADGWISKNTKPREWLDQIRAVLGEG